MVARLLDDDWRVVVPWIAERELDRVERSEGLELIKADLSDPMAVAQVVSVATAGSGMRLRGLVNLVGGFSVAGRVHETPIEEFDEQFRLNLRPTFLMTQAVVSPMVDAGGGSIVCTGTRAALQPF